MANVNLNTLVKLQSDLAYMRNHLSDSKDDIRFYSEDLLGRWHDSISMNLENIIQDCLKELTDSLRYLEAIDSYLRETIQDVEAYEAIAFETSANRNMNSQLNDLGNISGNDYGTSDNVSNGIRNQILQGPRSKTVEQVKSWLGEINPNYNGNPYSRWSCNCGTCALAVFMRINGHPTATATDRTLTIQEMNDATGLHQTSMTPSEIQNYLMHQPPGTCVVVGIDRSYGQPGHWFNAFFDGSEVYAIDGQINDIFLWPPDYGAVHWDVSIPEGEQL